MAQHVEVNGAPGFVDHFKAVLIPGLDHLKNIRNHAEEVAVVLTEAGDLHVVPSSTVTHVDSPEAARYRAEWAVKADRNHVYIPEALR